MTLHATTPRLTVYYDGGCAVCSREIGFYQRMRGAERLDWVDVTRCDPADLGRDLTPAAALARLHVRVPDGKLVSGARAFAALWSALPGTRVFGQIARQPGIVHLLEAGYRGFLRLRRLWRDPGRCRLPG
ncbi:MAG: hypothetical protein B7Y26_07980 [Hydrogenophilales bacterium 16-64-46]|nr:MAG: hypothetical protein B7Z32_08520 [Hydrogenophilales bacterium 12-64-13]OYZ05679.1 MAG: hypothetical protein B7Y26_07980 [Hydrogenophilales bacterium 16-64-46]OZA40258.1 MAG: hypothetical protein B7X87_01360 [Hydrogenophilales bacterium 17-64-34]HQT00809.1 DUF393 domain-containing protein [Thiobacillus sp.]